MTPEEDALYTKNLESLVKARTEQWQQAMREIERLEGVLKEIQSMDSVAEIRQAIQAVVEKHTPEERQPPRFGGKAGEAVPAVDPDDIKAVWKIYEETRAQAVGFEIMKEVCKPGANVEATWYRLSGIGILTHVAQQELAPWVREGQIADPVFRTMASIPMKWIGPGPGHGLPFDMEEFLRSLEAA